MSTSLAMWWWVAAGIAVAIELATGTFYLLMLALGLAAAAIAAHLGLALTGQMIAFALIGGGSVAIWHWRRAREPRSAPAASNRDVNLDIGGHVRVAAWADDGSAQVHYRGANWQARLAPGNPAAPGDHQIVAIEGNWLVLAPAQTH